MENKEELDRWRKLLTTEEFRSKFPNEALEYIISETIDKLSDGLPELGSVGNGLYHIGGGCYTGKDGWDKFEIELKKEFNK